MAISLINPHLRAVARWRVGSDVLDDSEFEKVAQPPGMDPAAGGGGPPMPDPMAMAAGGGGGAAPAGGAPPMGGAPPPPPGPLDPAMLAQLTQAMQGAGGGAAGGPGGKGAGKKAEQQLLDTKLWTIQFLLVKICESMNIQVPPSIVIGPPPDQSMMQQAQQEQAAPGGGGANIQGPNDMGGGAPGGGAPPGPGPIPPMDASQGPIGGAPGGGEKMGFAIRSLSSLVDEDHRRPFDVGSEYSLETLRDVRSKSAALAALSRSLKNGAA